VTGVGGMGGSGGGGALSSGSDQTPGSDMGGDLWGERRAPRISILDEVFLYTCVYMLRCVAVCCSVLQGAAVCCNVGGDLVGERQAPGNSYIR